MDASKQKKKRRKRSHNQSNVSAHHHSSKQSAGKGLPLPDRQQQQQQQHHRQNDKQKRHQEALALSQQLRQLSSQKRLKECIDLYRSPANDELRDAHHGSIVVDCCARCGDVNEAEQIVFEMLQSRRRSKKIATCPPFFWEEYKQFSYKQVPIQAWTALLKGYVHSGLMAKADSLFNHLCVTYRSKAAGGGDGGNKLGKRKREGAETGPNVRTLNTLLRGCLWTATSLSINSAETMKRNCTPQKELVGGLVTAERAWSLCGDVNIACDSSSYEYFISILAQSLQCKAAEDCLQNMRTEFGIPECNAGKDNAEAFNGADPAILESVVVCLVVIARGYAMLGKPTDGSRCVEEALRYIEISDANKMSTPPSSTDKSPAKKKTTGGKKAWRDSKASVNALEDDGRSSGRREESNKLFRSHRLSELRSELLSLQDLCSQASDTLPKEAEQAHSLVTENASNCAQFLMTRLLYFSGGGTTGKDATKANIGTKNSNVEEDSRQLIHSLWHSFGLKEIVKCLLADKDSAIGDIFYSDSTKKKLKRHKHQLPSLLSTQMCDSLTSHIVGKGSLISSDSGYINFDQVFKSVGSDACASLGAAKPLNIELGAGSGDWACLQAELNPSENYVTVELRADRVAQTFAKCTLHQQQSGGQSRNAPLINLCCVGSECGSFLRDRVEPGSVKTIFVNHPEPPTQTYSAEIACKAGSAENVEDPEEPAHMLNSQTILSGARCLEPNGEGRFIIVTDNLIYARLICHTLVDMLEKDATLVGLFPREVRDLRRIESFGRSSIHLYEGKPSLSIGHHTTQKFQGGTSYFDRLWRTGAGKYADMRKRFIIGLRTSGGSNSHNIQVVKSTRPTGPNEEGKRAGKKKSAEKQRRRNERRLLKKQQLAQKEKE